MIFKVGEIEIDESDIFKNDKLNRSSEVENLCGIITSIGAPLTIAFNSPWGTGKTTLTKMVKARLSQSGEKVVYFSAWETDFSEDPLATFLGEINTEIDCITKGNPKTTEAWGKAKRLAKYITKKGLPVAARVATGGLLNLDTAIEDAISSLTHDATADVVEQYTAARDAIDEFKENIAKATEDSRIYVFIDELDRCRPTYAIELLERIKHLLAIPSLVFIISIDKSQLSHSIRSVYGDGFDAAGYLKRFIDVEYNAATNPTEDFLHDIIDRIKLDKFFDSRKHHEDLSYERDWLVKTYQALHFDLAPSLRDIEQFFSRVNLIACSTPKNQHLRPALIVLMLHIKEHEPAIYSDIKLQNRIPESIYEIVDRLAKTLDEKHYEAIAMLEAEIMNCRDLADQGYDIKRLDNHQRTTTALSSKDPRRKYSEALLETVSDMRSSSMRKVSLEKLLRKVELLEKFTFPSYNTDDN